MELEPFQHLAAQGAMIDRLSSDSRRCAPGVAFFAYPGEVADGRAYIAEALHRGAAAVLWEEENFAWRGEWRVPQVSVRGLKEKAGALASAFYGRPSAALWMCGVTGTNGKTSCTQWLAALLARRGIKTGVIGTLGTGFPGRLDAVANTTPDALEIHRILKEMLIAGGQAAAMEVSSHGLAQGRANAVAFNCALFTNLTHDHLDYHGSMQAYGQAKARLFETPGLETAVLNLDDAFGRALAAKLAARGLRTIGYSLSGQNGASQYLHATLIDGPRLELDSSWGRACTSISALGRFNVSNALGVLGALIAFGVPFQEASELLRFLPAVSGRMEKIADEPLVVVDYAHTPDALEKVLQALRPVAERRGGRLTVVFGAGGDRDPAKRPLMGEIAARLADRVLVSSDNPRSEDPLAIIAAIRRGSSRPVDIEPDRAKAIAEAITSAAAADVVLIAGKGHENYQDIAGKRMPFSDAAVAREALQQRRHS